MGRSSILLLVVFGVAAYGLAFAAATVLAEILALPWRRSKESHWTERARLAFAPGMAVLWLAALLPALAGMVGFGLMTLDPGLDRPLPVFGTLWLATFSGVMTARYRWLRELWGPRVTFRTWLAGCLVVMFALIPHWLVMALLFFGMPDVPGRQAAIFFGAGILAVVFFAAGGGVLLLRLLGVARAAPPALTQMVEQLALEMKVPGGVKVFELEWAQVNAVAWVIHRSVGFSRPLLEVMRQDEVRAVAAHELAHLIEPRGVRMVRVAHMFAYLPAVPVIKYGGAAGLLAGYLLIVGVALAYKRFTRRLEQRADSLEHEAIGDREVYMRSMVALHRANVVPAIVPGTQTHPHLYDRLLAAGVQPEFAKPMAPARGKPMWVMLATALVTLAALVFILVAVGVALRLGARWA